MKHQVNPPAAGAREALPIKERKRWLLVARRRYLAAQRRKAA